MTDALVGQIITSGVTLVVALIGFLKLKSGQDQLRKDVDGKMTLLLEIKGAKERAEGKAEGKSEQRAEAKEDSGSIVDVKIVDQEKPVTVITDHQPGEVLDVKIVDQVKEVKVIVENPKKKTP